MKISSITADPLEHSSSRAKGDPVRSPTQGPDLLPAPKPPHRKTKKSGGKVRLRSGAAAGSLAGRGARPETPFLRWKFGEDSKDDGFKEEEETPSKDDRRNGRRVRIVMSARKVGSALWRMQLLEMPTSGGNGLGFQSRVGEIAVPFHSHRSCKVEPSSQFLNSAMEGATKWDPIGWKTSGDVKQLYGNTKLVRQQDRSALVISSLEAELEKARTRIHELETEGRSSKKKLEHFLKKLSEERAAWRSREHEKVRAIIDDLKLEVSRESKSRQRLEIVNSRLVNELADAKLSAKRYMQDYEKERKARKLIEEVCDELAKEIGEDKTEIEELKRESTRLREEVEEERKMLQMAEVWREERVQMKLVDAKVMLEDKYAQMNRLIADLESLLHSRGANPSNEEVRKAELLRQAAAALNIQDIRELTYDPPNPDDILSGFGDVNYCEHNERLIEPCAVQSPASLPSKVHMVSSEGNAFDIDKIQRRSNLYVDQTGDLEDDGSEWETVSHLEDQGSSYSPGASNPSVGRSHRHSNVSRSGSEWEGNRDEGTPINEVRKVCSLPNRQLKKTSSISRFWRSSGGNGENYNIISLEGVKGRLSSNGTIHSPEYGSGKGGLSLPDLSGQWGSPDSTDPHMSRGMKGCIEWSRSAQKNSLKSKLFEARLESQKVQLRQVLKQKI